MKPLPSEEAPLRQSAARPGNPLPSVLPDAPPIYSNVNRRAASGPLQRVYPWLLFTSTAVAAVFFLMYLTKPVIVQADGTAAPSESSNNSSPAPYLATKEVGSALLPSGEHLPGEVAAIPSGDPRQTLPIPGADSPFEETNLRVQHVLTAETTGGDQSRIVLDVPVLYQSRSLRWTTRETTEARELLIQLADYQEKSLALRAEGVALLDAWNALVERTIPAAELRADSPTLPTNQQDAATAPRPAGLDTTESIRLQNPSGQ